MHAISQTLLPVTDFTGPVEHNRIGQRFGNLTVIGYSDASFHGHKGGRWVVRCDCGVFARHTTTSLRKGTAQHCTYTAEGEAVINAINALEVTTDAAERSEPCKPAIERFNANRAYTDTARQCWTGKKVYLSYKGAQRVLRTFKLRSDNYKQKGRFLEIYRCEHCRGLHIGNSQRTEWITSKRAK